MLLTHLLERYKTTGLVYVLMTPVELPGSTLPSNELCYYLYLKKNRLYYHKRDAVHHRARWSSVSRAGIWVTFMQTQLCTIVTAPLPQLSLWNRRKTSHYQCRAKESSQGRIHLLEKNNGLQHDMPHMTCFLHIFRQKCHSNISTTARLLIKHW